MTKQLLKLWPGKKNPIILRCLVVPIRIEPTTDADTPYRNMAVLRQDANMPTPQMHLLFITHQQYSVNNTASYRAYG